MALLCAIVDWHLLKKIFDTCTIDDIVELSSIDAKEGMPMLFKKPDPDFDPCFDRDCGEKCHTCPPDAIDCPEEQTPYYCNQDLECTMLNPSCSEPKVDADQTDQAPTDDDMLNIDVQDKDTMPGYDADAELSTLINQANEGDMFIGGGGCSLQNISPSQKQVPFIILIIGLLGLLLIRTLPRKRLVKEKVKKE